MVNFVSTLLVPALLLGALAPIVAQQPDAKAADPIRPGADKLKLVHAALDAMVATESVAMTTKHRTENSLFGRGGGATPLVLEVVKHRDVLAAEYPATGLRVVTSGRRTITADKGSEFHLTRPAASGSDPLPYVFDPDVVFTALRHCEGLSVAHADVGTCDNCPVEIITLTAAGDAATQLTQAGVVAECTGQAMGGGGGAVMFAAGGGGIGAKAAATVDVALFIDPATKRILRARMRAYVASPVQAMLRARLAAGAAGAVVAGPEDENEAAESKPKDPAGPAWRDGLPVRDDEAFTNATKHTLDATFRDFGKAKLPELPAAATRLLR